MRMISDRQTMKLLPSPSNLFFWFNLSLLKSFHQHIFQKRRNEKLQPQSDRRRKGRCHYKIGFTSRHGIENGCCYFFRIGSFWMQLQAKAVKYRMMSRCWDRNSQVGELRGKDMENVFKDNILRESTCSHPDSIGQSNQAKNLHQQNQHLNQYQLTIGRSLIHFAVSPSIPHHGR